MPFQGRQKLASKRRIMHGISAGPSRQILVFFVLLTMLSNLKITTFVTHASGPFVNIIGLLLVASFIALIMVS